MNRCPRSTSPDGARVAAARVQEGDLFDDSDFWEGFVESVSVIARRRISRASVDKDLESTHSHL